MAKAAIRVMQSYGTPYDVFYLSNNAGLPTLESDGTGKYNAILLSDENMWEGESALMTDALASHISKYMLDYCVRAVYMNSFPTPEIGMTTGVVSYEQTYVSLNTEGQSIAPGIKAGALIPVTPPIPGAAQSDWFETDVVDGTKARAVAYFNPGGHVAAAIITHADGREDMRLFMTQGEDLLHTHVLAEMWFPWMNRDVYVGMRRERLTPFVADLFNIVSVGNVVYRASASDYQRALNSATAAGASLPSSSWVIPCFGFNGVGVANMGGMTVDPLYLAAQQSGDRASFVSHTYTGTGLEVAEYAEALDEIALNQPFGAGLPYYSEDVMQAPSSAAMENRDVIEAMRDSGFADAVTDNTSPSGVDATNPYLPGMSTTSNGGHVTALPRQTTSLCHTCATPNDVVEHFNAVMGMSTVYTYEDVLSYEAYMVATRVLAQRHDTFLMYQANLIDYGSGQSVFDDWMARTAEYVAQFTALPVQSARPVELASEYRVHDFVEASDCPAVATSVQGSVTDVSFGANSECDVYVTGIDLSGAGMSIRYYGPDVTSMVTMSVGEEAGVDVGCDPADIALPEHATLGSSCAAGVAVAVGGHCTLGCDEEYVMTDPTSGNVVTCSGMGWTSTEMQCTKWYNPCVVNPCDPLGSQGCIANEDETRTCQCIVGYEGDDCSIPLTCDGTQVVVPENVVKQAGCDSTTDDFHSVCTFACAEGSVSVEGSVTIACGVDGYPEVDLMCTTDWCADEPCDYNGASLCTNEMEGPVCTCREGYGGAYCHELLGCWLSGAPVTGGATSPECGGVYVPFGESCSWECDVGYKATGDASATVCDDELKTWVGDGIGCEYLGATCDGAAYVPPLNTVVVEGCDSAEELYGSTCTLMCSPGYRYTGSADIFGSVECLEDGYDALFMWDCVESEVTCDGLAAAEYLPDHARVASGCASTEDPYNSLCILECEEGYRPAGDGTGMSVCTDGGYTSFDLVCVPITGCDCDTLVLPDYIDELEYAVCPTADYAWDIGHVIDVSCMSGYELNPEYEIAALICLATGYWESPADLCIEKLCSVEELEDALAAGIEVVEGECEGADGVSIGEVCALQCKEGWRDVDADGAKAKCEEEGWTIAEAVCEQIVCDGLDVSVPDGAYMSSGCISSNDVLGSQCTVSCLSGYTQTGGENTIQCTEDGYTNATIVCEKSSDDGFRDPNESNGIDGEPAEDPSVPLAAILVPACVMGGGAVLFGASRYAKNRRAAAAAGEAAGEGEGEGTSMENVDMGEGEGEGEGEGPRAGASIE